MKATVHTLTPRAYSYYLLADDFWPGGLAEVAWSTTFRPGELHAIELTDGRVIFRCVCAVTPTELGPALKIYGAGGAQLLPRAFVRRVGNVRRIFCVQGRSSARAKRASVVHMDAWLKQRAQKTSEPRTRS